MTNYDLTSIGAVSASAKLAHIRVNQELDQSSYIQYTMEPEEVRHDERRRR